MSTQVLCPFFNLFLCCSCCWVLGVLCIFWILIPYQIYDLQIFFPHSVGCHFTLWIISFNAHFKNLLNSICLFIVVTCAFGVISKKSLPSLVSWSFCPRFSSKSFIVLGLTFRSLIHYELIFIDGVRWESNFILWHVNIQFSQHYFF